MTGVDPSAGRRKFLFGWMNIGTVSPDFYGWVFPHGDTISVGTGSAVKGFSLRDSVGAMRKEAGLGARCRPWREIELLRIDAARAAEEAPRLDIREPREPGRLVIGGGMVGLLDARNQLR